MTIRMAHKDFSSRNKVCNLLHPFLTQLVLQLIRFTVSHHPPISAFYYVSPANKVAIVGELRPKSKFLGNSVSTTMEGESRITLTDRPEDAGKRLRAHHQPHHECSLSNSPD